MSHENLKLVSRLYEAVNRDDGETIRTLIDPEAQFDWSRRQIDPWVRQGRDAVRDAVSEMNAPWTELTVEVEELVDIEDRVLAFIRVQGRGAASGAEVDAHVGHLWTIRDGLVVQMTYYGDRAEAREAAGVPPAT